MGPALWRLDLDSAEVSFLERTCRTHLSVLSLESGQSAHQLVTLRCLILFGRAAGTRISADHFSFFQSSDERTEQFDNSKALNFQQTIVGNGNGTE